MATIDIGSLATDRGSSKGYGFTFIVKENPANKSGKITSIKIWANINLVNCEVATFFVVSGTNFSTRDTHTIGSVTAGSEQTFPVDLDVQSGDYIGVYYTGGFIEGDNTGSGYWYENSDQIPCTNFEFTSLSDRTISLYGTGILSMSVGGNLGFSGSLHRLMKKMLSGNFDFSGVVAFKFLKSLSGAFELTGSVGFIFKKALSGVITFTQASLTVMVNIVYQKIIKAIANYTKTDKDTSTYTKVDKEDSEYTKKDKERGEEL